MNQSSGSTRFAIIKLFCLCVVLLLSACSGRVLPPATTLPGTVQALNTATSLLPIPALTVQSTLTNISTPTSAPTLTKAAVPTGIPLPTGTSLAASPSPTVLPAPSETPDTTPEPMNITMFDEKSGWLEVGYAVGQGHLFHTLDGGKTWQDVSPEPSSLFLSRAFLNAQTAWELVSPPATFSNNQTNDQPGTLYRTTDGGKTWDSTTVPFSDQVYLTFLDAQQGRAEKVTVCGAGTCMAKFYQTSDGGIEADTPEVP